MKAALAELRPLLKTTAAKEGGSPSPPSSVVVIGTAKGDIHDIGKNLVSAMLEGSGVTVVDLGVDVAPEAFAAAAKAHAAQVVAVSALLTTTMAGMRDVVNAVGASAKVVVGGAPVTAAFANSIGATGYAPDASSAARLIKQLMAATGQQ
jgi:5-methyltetrahydrofolate--homocysteine methyltransferase